MSRCDLLCVIDCFHLLFIVKQLLLDHFQVLYGHRVILVNEATFSSIAHDLVEIEKPLIITEIFTSFKRNDVRLQRLSLHDLPLMRARGCITPQSLADALVAGLQRITASKVELLTAVTQLFGLS